MKVGELARVTGLTVRTLHHWEERGLVVPSARTASGHRVYDDGDVRGVYQVVALRELGLPLEAIGGLLSSGSFADVLTAHLDQVDARLAALHALRGTLAAVVDRLRDAPDPDPADVLMMIDEVSRVNDTFAQYFTPEQVAELRARRAEGEAAAAAWPGLIAACRPRWTRAPTRRSRACRRSPRGGRSCWRPSTVATSRCSGSCTGCGRRTPTR